MQPILESPWGPLTADITLRSIEICLFHGYGQSYYKEVRQDTPLPALKASKSHCFKEEAIALFSDQPGGHLADAAPAAAEGKGKKAGEAEEVAVPTARILDLSPNPAAPAPAAEEEDDGNQSMEAVTKTATSKSAKRRRAQKKAKASKKAIQNC